MAGQGLWRRVRALPLGDFPPAYSEWVTALKKLGAEISTLPNDPKPIMIEGRRYPRVAAVFRNPLVWGPLVNARKLPTPTTYTKDGRTAYFLAPDAVQSAFAKGTDTSSQVNADNATPDLLNRWKFPDLTQYVKPALIGGGVLLGLYALNTARSFVPRVNPPRRRRMR